MAFDNLDFLNTNSLRNYPIKEGITKLSADGIFTIPDDFIVDFMLAASSNIDARFYISKIVNLAESITIEIKDSSGVTCGFFSISVASHVLYKTYYLAASDTYVGANGKIVIGSLSSMQLSPTGTYNFVIDTAELETRTIIPSLNTINRLTFVNADLTTSSVTGNVKIGARTNIKFSTGTTNTTNDTIIMDVGNDLGLNAPCDSNLPAIKTINNIGPDTNGNFTLMTTNCASVAPLNSNTGLLFSDTCCKPCMGCDEISTLTDRVVQIETDILKLRDHYTNLQSLITEFSNLMNFQCSC